MPDTTEHDRLVKELQTVNQELQEFAYVVSHDLKAPLRAIDSLVQWIAEDYADKFDDTGREQMDLLIGRVRRMQNLIDGVLQYSRIGRVRDEPFPVDLHRLVEQVIDSLAPPSHITVTIRRPLPTLTCEKLRVQQVFQNLLSNAIKFMDKPRGEVWVDGVEEDGVWHFSVGDNGPGIDPRHFERVFQLFQTLQSRDEYESTGIGLTLVKKIIELHGGRVWVASEVGQGSVFHVTLPVTA